MPSPGNGLITLKYTHHLLEVPDLVRYSIFLSLGFMVFFLSGTTASTAYPLGIRPNTEYRVIETQLQPVVRVEGVRS
jgi:hypothetical protein